MTYTLQHGVTLHDDAEGAVVQSVKIKGKAEKSTLLGMVDGTTEIVGVWAHTHMSEFSVTGSGDIEISPGVVADAGLPSLTGGKLGVWDFEVEEQVGQASKWAYNGEHYPHATLGDAA